MFRRVRMVRRHQHRTIRTPHRSGLRHRRVESCAAPIALERDPMTVLVLGPSYRLPEQAVDTGLDLIADVLAVPPELAAQLSRQVPEVSRPLRRTVVHERLEDLVCRLARNDLRRPSRLLPGVFLDAHAPATSRSRRACRRSRPLGLPPQASSKRLSLSLARRRILSARRIF